MYNLCEACLLMPALPYMPSEADKAWSERAGRMAHVRLGLSDCM